MGEINEFQGRTEVDGENLAIIDAMYYNQYTYLFSILY